VKNEEAAEMKRTNSNSHITHYVLRFTFYVFSLLLLVPPAWAAEGEKKKEPADNSRCHVCHINFADEPFAVSHAKQGTGCEKCHGPSDAHAGDEDNITPPDILFPADKLNVACMECHDRAKLIRKEEHEKVFKDLVNSKDRCIDCHGKHKMARRTVRWDKVTRKLLPKEEKPKP
jgi:hypothetical protein